MNEEIKEILDKFSNRKQGTLLQAIRELKEQDVKHACVTTEENINKLLNYITNLQKENENLQITVNDCKQEKENFRKLKERYQLEKGIYKSRNEKAIEYIKNTTLYGFRSGKTLLSNYLDDLLNILQGGDE